MTSLSRAKQAQLAAEIQANAPAPEWDSVPELRKWKEPITIKGGEKKSMTFDQLVIRYKDIKSEIAYRESILVQIRTSLEAAMLVADQKEVSCEGYPVTLITRKGSRKIIPEKLLEQGVTADVIARATETGAESTFVQVGKPKKD